MATGMHVPEAPVNVDDLAEPGEHQVRRSGQIPAMEPEAVSEAVGDPTDEDFWRGIPRLYRRHDSDSAAIPGFGFRPSS